MKQRKGLMNHRSLVRAKGNFKLSYSGSSQTRHLTKLSPQQNQPLTNSAPKTKHYQLGPYKLDPNPNNVSFVSGACIVSMYMCLAQSMACLFFSRPIDNNLIPNNQHHHGFRYKSPHHWSGVVHNCINY